MRLTHRSKDVFFLLIHVFRSPMFRPQSISWAGRTVRDRPFISRSATRRGRDDSRRDGRNRRRNNEAVPCQKRRSSAIVGKTAFLRKRAESRATTQGRKSSRIKAVCRRGAATAESRRPATPVGIENVLHFRFCVKNCRPRAKRTGVFQAFSVIQTRHNGIGRLR